MIGQRQAKEVYCSVHSTQKETLNRVCRHPNCRNKGLLCHHCCNITHSNHETISFTALIDAIENTRFGHSQCARVILQHHIDLLKNARRMCTLDIQSLR
jgi:hypothetical protein